jgi:uncharacterized RDD family membrane protein YckC
MEERKYQTRGKRFFASLIDGIVFLPFIFLEEWLFTSTQSIWILFVWKVFLLIIATLYTVLLHFKYGKTIGKWVTGIKVIDVNEKRNLTLRQSIYRDIFYILVDVVALPYFLFMLINTSDGQHIIEQYDNFSTVAVFAWTILELITMLTNSKSRAIHDFLAGSVVVRA